MICHKNYLLIIFALFLAIPLASAVFPSYSNLSCGTTSSTLDTFIPPYASNNTGDYLRIDAWFRHEGADVQLTDTNTSVVIDYYNGTNETHGNFTYTGSAGKWYVLVSSNEETDFNFTVRTGCIEGTICTYECKSENATVKFRDPFTVFFTLYHSNKTGVAQPYANDFQYLFLTNYSMGWDDKWKRDSYSIAYLDKMFSWMPLYGSAKIATPAVDTIPAFWDDVDSDGTSDIKLYESGNYSMNLIRTKVMGLGWAYQFIYPQYDKDQSISTIQTNLEIVNETDTTVRVYVDAWEVMKGTIVMNWIQYTFYFIIYIVVGVLLFKFSPQLGLMWTVGFWLVIKLIAWLG